MTGPGARRFPIRSTGLNRHLWLAGLDLDPPAPTRLPAALRPRVRGLRVSVDDPGGLVALS